jgi:hypothetical protein
MKAVNDLKVTLGASIALLVVVGALTLMHSPPRVVRVATTSRAGLAVTTSGAEICQANEVLPAAVSAIRVSLRAYFGAWVRVTASSGSRVLTEGRRGPDWTGTSVTIPVKPLNYSASHVNLCIDVAPNSELIQFRGAETSARETAVSRSGAELGGRVGVEYLASGQGSWWWSRILSVARHVGLGHALSGTWVVLLIAALMFVAGALAVRLVLSEPPSMPEPPARPRSSGRASVGSRSSTRSQAKLVRATPPIVKAQTGQPRSGSSIGVRAKLKVVPTVAWTCALIALLNACAWSLIVPPFQGKDEADHFAYVEQLAEDGTLPKNGKPNGTYSAEEKLVLQGLDYRGVTHSPQTPAISSMAEQRALTRDINAGASLQGSGEAGVATPEPPLYYALQVIPYELGRGNILVQLQLMRLVGALFGAVTALLSFLFLREILPGAPWAATVGALCVALQPLFAFMSGSVNPDTMVFAVAAAVLLCLARAFRRGLTRRLAVPLGILIAVGFVTKLNFIGFAFGVFAGLVVLAVRETRAGVRQGWLSPVIAAGIGIAPAILYALRNILANDPTFGIVSGFTGVTSHEFSYIWQLYLPRLPGMTPYFSGITTFKDIWFDRSVGLYGWMDTMFPVWVDNVALVPVAVVALLCGRELVIRQDALRIRLPELSVYAAITVGVLVMIGASSYLSDVVHLGPAFGEPRYLLPLLPLMGGVVALAVRGAGRRWAPVVGGAIVMLFLGHDVFSQLQVIARYYG